MFPCRFDTRKLYWSETWSWKIFFFLLISHSFVYIKNTVRGPNLVQQLVTSGPAGVHQSIKEFNFCVKTDKWGDIFPTKTKTTIIYTVYIYIYPWGIRFFTGQQRKITEHWCWRTAPHCPLSSAQIFWWGLSTYYNIKNRISLIKIIKKHHNHWAEIITDTPMTEHLYVYGLNISFYSGAFSQSQVLYCILV